MSALRMPAFDVGHFTFNAYHHLTVRAGNDGVEPHGYACPGVIHSAG